MLKRGPLLLVSKSFLFRTTMECGKRKGKAMIFNDVNVSVAQGRENVHARSPVCAAVSRKVCLARAFVALTGVEHFVATFGEIIFFDWANFAYITSLPGIAYIAACRFKYGLLLEYIWERIRWIFAHHGAHSL